MGFKDVFRFGPPKDGDAGSSDQPDAARQDKRSKSEQQAAADEPGWTAGANLATKATVGLLWVALAAGPIALGLRVLTPPPQQLVASDGAAEEPGEISAVSEFAERAVVAWLEAAGRGSKDVLSEFFGDAEQIRPEYPWSADNVGVADVVKLDNGLWSVTVGADVAEGLPPQSAEDIAAGKEPEVPQIARQYYQVPIVYVNGAMRAQALPSPVPEPSLTDVQETAYRTNIGNAHPSYVSVAEFLKEMLTSGSSDRLRPFTAPGSNLPAIVPAPYTEIQLTDLQATADPGADDIEPTDGQQLEVLATAQVTASNRQQLSTQYALTLTARQGRWEVSALHASPELRDTVVSTPSAPVDQPDGGGGGGQPDSGGDEEPTDEPTGTDEPSTEGTGTDVPDPDGTTTEPPPTDAPATDGSTEEPPAEGSTGEPPADPASGANSDGSGG